jgi:polysaccharide export outer membrane protein
MGSLPPGKRPVPVSWQHRGLLRFFSLAGCQTTVSVTPSPPPPATTAVTLVPGDIVKLTFPGATELDQSQKIQSDGKINLPLVGEVDAAGSTISDLQRRLQVLYQPQLQNSTVTVTLESSVTQVTVGGAVKSPGNTF